MMPKASPNLMGAYLLVIRMDRKTRIQIGRLGTADFPPGFYVYCGSALKGLHSRVNRHLRSDKRLHWHIDYLLMAAHVDEVWTRASAERLECKLSEAVGNMSGAAVIVEHFGASDCRCRSHLWHFTRQPHIRGLEAGLTQVRFSHAAPSPFPL